MLVLGMVHFLEECHWETAIHMFYPAVRSGWLRHGRFGSVKSTALVFFFQSFFLKRPNKNSFLLKLSIVFFLGVGWWGGSSAVILPVGRWTPFMSKDLDEQGFGFKV